MSNVLLQPGFVLHHRAYRDTSVLLEFLTVEHGRVGAVARGVRKEKSRWAGMLQPFRPLLLSWMGRGELVTLTSVEENGGARLSSGPALMCGFYLNELMVRLLERHDAHPGLYTAYDDALRGLSNVERDPTAQESALRRFEKRLLAELGYGLILDHAADSGAALTPDTVYSYELERGPIAYNERSLGITVSGATLLALDHDALHDECSLRESKRLMRAVLAHYLGDKPLQSRALFQAAGTAPSPFGRGG